MWVPSRNGLVQASKCTFLTFNEEDAAQEILPAHIIKQKLV
jgi:hypothetical protein